MPAPSSVQTEPRSALGRSQRGGAVVAAITDMAHALGLTVTAEGVETQLQRDEVNALGCESAQGYFYARPMPASAISAHLGAAPTSVLHLPASLDALRPAS